MQAQGASGASLTLVIGFCVLAWASGAVFGWGLRELRDYLLGLRSGSRRPLQPLLKPIAAPAPPAIADYKPSSTARRRRTRRQRRGGGYYFSEESRGWGDGRWRRRLGWASAVMLAVVIGGSLGLALTSYKPTAHHHAPALRH